MRVLVPNISSMSIGGGWTFLKNLMKSATLIHGLEIVESGDYDVLLAFSPTTISGEMIERAKRDGKPFILRMDGVPEDNRNSGHGSRRMIEYARAADYIIYQTEFVRQTVGAILRMNGVDCASKIIMNGVDTDIFNPDGPKKNYGGAFKILNVAYRKDNNKRVEEVIQMWRHIWTQRQDGNLVMVGRYPTEWQDYNMGFFNGEKVTRVGVIDSDELKAEVIRSCDFMFFPSYADPAPNTVLESMACGVPVIYHPYGGTKELVGNTGFSLSEYDYHIDTYAIIINKIMADLPFAKKMARLRAEDFDLRTMGTAYREVIQTVLEMYR